MRIETIPATKLALQVASRDQLEPADPSRRAPALGLGKGQEALELVAVFRIRTHPNFEENDVRWPIAMLHALQAEMSSIWALCRLLVRHRHPVMFRKWF